MQTELFPVEEINIEERVRKSSTDSPEVKEHVERLMESIERYGLLQPVLLDQHNTLVDGWCRYTAYTFLAKKNPEKYATIPVHRREALSDSEYYELELETNLRRLGLNWRETVVAVCRIHRTRAAQAAKSREEWSMEMTGELLGGYSKSYVSNCVTLEPLINEISYDECGSITDALRVYYRRLEDQAVAEQARRTGLVKTLAPLESASVAKALGINPLPESVDDLARLIAAYPKDETPRQVDLSHSLFLGDSINDILPKWPNDCVDHIITDPPYAIDMDNLQQATTALMDVSRTEEEHQVEPNIALLGAMMPACYRVLRDGGYFAFFCDQMNWQYLYDVAIAAGFRVQRWPIVWCKPQAKCQMAHVLITKATEIVMVCRKGKAQLPTPVPLNWHLAGNDETKLSNPFAKPFEIWKFLYDCFTVEGQTVLDPFAGEGSSTIAGLKLNRRALAIELNPTHYNYLIEQVKTHWQSLYSNLTFV